GRDGAMNQEDAFLQAIREEPDDDAVRLIFADWLEERGDPRGEFIRLQCALAGMAEEDERRPALNDRPGKLLRQHRPRRVGSLSSRVTDYVFRRGFVEEITVSAAAFLTHGRELFDHHPIRTVRVFFLSVVTITDFTRSPYLDRVAALHLSNEELGDERVR